MYNTDTEARIPKKNQHGYSKEEMLNYRDAQNRKLPGNKAIRQRYT
jgi:hypothetical protein